MNLSLLLQLVISLAAVYGFYYLLLRRTTWYAIIRWYLLLYPAIAIALAVFPVSLWQSVTPTIPATRPAQVIPVSVSATIQAADNSYGFRQALLLVCCFVTSVMIVRLLLQWVSFFRFRKKAKLVTVIRGVSIYHVPAGTAPFAMGRCVYMNPDGYNDADLRRIYLHEAAHARQLHTLDIVWTECLVTLNWFNPFAWLIRKAVRDNLEYMADRAVTQQDADKRSYQYLLLKTACNHMPAFASAFSGTSLKKRIIMMNAARTGGIQWVRLLLLLPLTVLLFAFASRRQHAVQQPFPRSVALHKNDHMDAVHKKFFTNNPSLLLIYWKKKTTSVELYFEKEVIETYDLSKPAEAAMLVRKYGKLPNAAGSLVRK